MTKRILSTLLLSTLSTAAIATCDCDCPPPGPDPIPTPTDCSALVPLPTATPGKVWTKVISSRVMWGDGTVGPQVDATNYSLMWTYPGNTFTWPGNYGQTTRPSGAAPNQYFAERFGVPVGGNTRANWAFSGSGVNSNFSITVSACPGDFGQQGSQLTQSCRTDFSNSSGGIRVTVNNVPQIGFCTLKPNQVYYLNLLPMAHLPKNPYDLSKSNCSQSPCSPWVGLN